MRLAFLFPLLLGLCGACSTEASHQEETGAQQPLAAFRLARPNGPILDAADLLEPAAEQRLADRLTRLHQQTGHALVVVTVQSLGGDDIADYTRELANRWGVGSADRSDGVVLLVAPKERKVRIATGRGITELVPDALCARIINERITPHFKRGAMAAGIEEGVTSLTEAMTSA